ncbi:MULTISPECIES: hypothetical protein [unclassified Halomonas]|uniref:hypothetical protein n=1 Tax=unclassified Halomonas TaxID=2609666 RepID=UPI002076A995|nr:MULTISPECIES: hypothetical protein [unclassified Halomonas]
MHLWRVILFFSACFTLVSPTVADDWAAPENPDVLEVLNEARLDAMAGRYEEALEKHIWFYDKATLIDESVSAVRRSSALADWVRLGQEYQPALEKLCQTRDELLTKIMDGAYDSDSFHDLVAMNQILDEDSLTIEAFKYLDSTNPEAARRAFNFADAALIKEEEYALYGEYVSPQRDFLLMKNSYEHSMLNAEDPDFSASRTEFSINSFRNKAATLVAMLAVNGRVSEAEDIMSQAKEVLEDPSFHAELEAASNGNVPDPWP